MDIRLKSNSLKVVSFILSLYMLSLSVLALKNFKNDVQFLGSQAYFKSEDFKNNLVEFMSLFMEYNINYKDYLSKPADEKISKEELKSSILYQDTKLKEAIQEAENFYSLQIEAAESSGNKDKLAKLEEEKKKKLEDIKKEYNKTEEDFKKELIDRSSDYYSKLKKRFEAKTDLRYYLKDSVTNTIYTNLPNINDFKEYIKNNAMYTINLPLTSSKQEIYNHPFLDLGYEGYIIVPYGGTHLSLSRSFDENRFRAITELMILALTLPLGIILLTLSLKSNLAVTEPISSIQALYKKIPFDVKFIAFVIALLFIPGFLEDGTLFYGNQLNLSILLTLTLKVILLFYFYLSLPELIDILKNKKRLKPLLAGGAAYKLKILFNKGLKDKSLLLRSFVFITTIIIVISATFAITMSITGGDQDLFVICLLFYIALFTAYIIKQSSLLNKIVAGTGEIVAGNLSFSIKEKGNNSFSRLAHNINNMKLGISKAVENQMKSDRLKSELITNVSHDLKTPLTSIINYVDLLKRGELTKEEMKDYIGVLDRKTQRLKVLIEDLFEASKMASGSVELNIEKVDVAQLLTQSLAEFDEKIKTSALGFKVNIPHHKVYANLDGKKIWRVFENLIGNTLKYSQVNTRVYIDLVETENHVTITIKNISAYEMDFDVVEIFDRFKRGDASRATEGSGLGLAIAKSIVDLHNGKLNIEIDGDLFKAIVEFKK